MNFSLKKMPSSQLRQMTDWEKAHPTHVTRWKDVDKAKEKNVQILKIG